MPPFRAGPASPTIGHDVAPPAAEHSPRRPPGPSATGRAAARLPARQPGVGARRAAGPDQAADQGGDHPPRRPPDLARRRRGHGPARRGFDRATPRPAGGTPPACRGGILLSRADPLSAPDRRPRPRRRALRGAAGPLVHLRPPLPPRRPVLPPRAGR